MFRGRHAHTIDAKGRISIPAGFRAAFQECSENPPIITNVKTCLAMYPYEDWMKIEEKLRAASQVQPAVQAYQRFVVSGAVPCPIDGQGRILIPPHLREHARLEREVTIAGVGPRLEIWDRALFQQELQRTVSDFDEISEVVARLERNDA